MQVEKLKNELLLKHKKPSLPLDMGLSSGSTLINLACTGNPNIAFFPSYFYALVGASRAGKTWLLLQTLAEASINPKYKDYRLILDQPERGALMDVRRYFGRSLAKRLEAPGRRGSSRTIEEFYDYVDDAVRKGTPFIYGLDSEDALTSEAEKKKSEQNKKIRRKKVSKSDGEEGDGSEDAKVKGSYGDGKAKINAAGMRQSYGGLEDTDPGSILFMIKQAKDNPAAGPFGEKQTKSGGRSITYYNSNEIWFNIKTKIRQKILGRPRILGSLLNISVKKNRVDGWEGTVEVPFYRSYGIDDLGSCIAFLLLERHWKKRSGGIHAVEFDFTGKESELIEYLEQEECEQEVKLITAKVWHKIEEACKIKRKLRYE